MSAIGEHTEEILIEMLGMNWADVTALRDRRVILSPLPEMSAATVERPGGKETAIAKVWQMKPHHDRARQSAESKP